MRFVPLLPLAACLAQVAAAATPPAHCTATGTVDRASVSSDGTRVRLRGTISVDSNFDPQADGLLVHIALEPEADEGNTLALATIPGDAIRWKDGRLRYHDSTGAQGGITLVKTDSRATFGLRFAIVRKGVPAVVKALHPSSIRLSLTAGSTCARTCGAPCAQSGAGGLSCRAGTDTELCGFMSGCELLGLTDAQYATRECLLPYPSSSFERTDDGSVTGRRLALRRFAMPANTSGVHMDATHWNTLDGWSPGPIITSYFRQGVDLAASNVPPLTDWAASIDPASPTVLIEADASGCARVEHFGENDVSSGVDGQPIAPPNQVFMIRPGRRLKNTRRYIVALRGLVGPDGAPIAPSPVFAALRDGTVTGSAAVEARRPAMEAIFAKLEGDCGIARSSLLLAWDFTVASDDSLNRWLLHMRDDAFAKLGSGAPAYSITTVQDDPFPGDARVCRLVRGTYTVPLYTTFNGPGSLLNLDPETDLPVQNGEATDVPFAAIIPCSLTSPPAAGRPIFYGHGLLGSGNEAVNASNLRTLADTHGFVIAATDWQGFSNADTPTIVGFISDLSEFRKLPERLLQGILNQLVLARLLGAPDGLAADPAFQYGGTSVIDPSEVFYYGNSQGGIEGGVVMAIAQEVTRGVLGVPAANYSTLLHRSVDFDPYFLLLKLNYPDDVYRNLTIPLIQQLWDRAEPNGWYHHTVTGGSLPDTPPHKVLVHMATSDDEVANLGTEIMVRSMGIGQIAPVVRSYYGIVQRTTPYDGSAMVESDGGYGPVPLTNTPPADNDAHGAMRARPAIQAQISEFLKTGGRIENFCAGACNPE
jgi:hypothetical protein